MVGKKLDARSVSLICNFMISTYLKSAFLISFITYLLLFLAEAIRPGFVSYHFSAHWVLGITLLLFVGMLLRKEQLAVSPYVALAMVFLLGLIFAMVTWKLMGDFRGMRVLLTLVAVCLPYAVFRTFDGSS